MTVARARADVGLAPEAAFDLWTDVARWPGFVDGFGHVESHDESWPAEGAEVVWRSIPAGRGRVAERVVASRRGELFATSVEEERLTGTQTVRLAAAEGGTRVELDLDYRVAGRGPLRALTDVLFIRRAENDALARTLRRFATEAAEEASL